MLRAVGISSRGFAKKNGLGVTKSVPLTLLNYLVFMRLVRPLYWNDQKREYSFLIFPELR